MKEGIRRTAAVIGFSRNVLSAIALHACESLEICP